MNDRKTVFNKVIKSVYNTVMLDKEWEETIEFHKERIKQEAFCSLQTENMKTNDVEKLGNWINDEAKNELKQ